MDIEFELSNNKKVNVIGGSCTMKLGNYEPHKFQTKKCESTLEGLQEHDTFWTIYLGNDSYFDVKTQAEAEIISRLVHIEELLRKKKNLQY